MRNTDFQKNSPGKLVKTRAYDTKPGEKPVPVDGFAFVPDPLPPELEWSRIMGAVWKAHSEAERNLGLLEGKASRLTDPSLLHGPFMRQEARLSSLIEDTVTTPEELVLAEAGQPVPRVEAHEVNNYLRALRHGWDSELPICGRLIKTMHGILLEGARGGKDRPGEYRREQNYIGDEQRGFRAARFVPPPAGDTLEKGMRDLEIFTNKAHDDFPQLVAMALAHYQFEALHPFRDGNGRLGRLLIVLWMRKQNLLSHPLMYVSAFFERHREDYKNLLLRISTHGEWEPWINFVLRGVATEAASSARRIDNLLELRSKILVGVTTQRRSILCQKLVDYLFTKPALTVSTAAQVLGISDTAATTHIRTLEEKGVLVCLNPRNKPRVYLARGIIAAASRED